MWQPKSLQATMPHVVGQISAAATSTNPAIHPLPNKIPTTPNRPNTCTKLKRSTKYGGEAPPSCNKPKTSTHPIRHTANTRETNDGTRSSNRALGRVGGKRIGSAASVAARKTSHSHICALHISSTLTSVTHPMHGGKTQQK